MTLVNSLMSSIYRQLGLSLRLIRVLGVHSVDNVSICCHDALDEVVIMMLYAMLIFNGTASGGSAY